MKQRFPFFALAFFVISASKSYSMDGVCPPTVQAECPDWHVQNCPPGCAPSTADALSGQSSSIANDAMPSDSSSGVPQQVTPTPEPDAQPAFNLNEQSVAFASRSAAFNDMSIVGAYLDCAIPITQVRVRYDNAQGGDSNRGEYLYGFYPVPTFQQVPAPGGGSVAINGSALPVLRRLDYQEVSMYLESAFSRRFSVFAELPFRFINLDTPQINIPPYLEQRAGTITERGLSDINFGFKYAVIANRDRFVTFQLKTYAPSLSQTIQPNPTFINENGAQIPLGNSHYSIEPGILSQRRVNDRLTVFSEVRDWISISPSEASFDNGTGTFGPFDFVNANILRIGVGMGYDIMQKPNERRRLTAIGEFAGWTILDGREQIWDSIQGLDSQNNPVEEFTNPRFVDSTGDTIVNFKYGLRYTIDKSLFYVGAGHALTSKDWYDSILRIELTRRF